MELTQEYLKSVLHYDPDTGIFTWLAPTANRVRVGDIAGGLRERGYHYVYICNKRYRAHRLAYLYMTGDWPIGEIDHINGVRDDNRWVNLRAVSRTENQRNKKRPKNNASGTIGVSWSKQSSKWFAHIKIAYKCVNLGFFSVKDDAIAARKAAEKLYGFHENHGR